MVGILLSYWEGLFSEAMLVSERVVWGFVEPSTESLLPPPGAFCIDADHAIVASKDFKGKKFLRLGRKNTMNE